MGFTVQLTCSDGRDTGLETPSLPVGLQVSWIERWTHPHWKSCCSGAEHARLGYWKRLGKIFVIVTVVYIGFGKHLRLCSIQKQVVYSTDSERPHRCCHLPNKVENIDCTPDILYTLQLTGRSPLQINFPYPLMIRAPKMWLWGPTWVHTPNGTSIGSSVFVGLTDGSDQHY